MDIKFHLPNFIDYYDARINYTLIAMMKQAPGMFYEGAKIGSIFDCFPVIWNGGRIVAGYLDKEMLDRQVSSTLKIFNSVGVPCRFTFTNPVLTEKDLDDYSGNRILELADNGMNEAIVFSPLLEEHIRKTHPNIKLISSTCKQILDYDGICSELEKDYEYVVLDYGFNNNFEFLSTLPHKEKCEILANAVCEPRCPRRGAHYRFIGEYQLGHCNPEELALIREGKAKVPEWACPHMKNNAFTRRKSSAHVKPQDIYTKYANLGFTNFKLEGRGNNFVDLAEQYVYYLVKPEYRDAVRYNLLISAASAMGSGRRA